MFTLIKHPTFTKQIKEFLSDDEYASFQKDLAASPESGDVIPGLGGLRKVRMAAKGKGKRGGARVVYLLVPAPGVIILFYVCTKGNIEDLSSEQKKRLRAAVETIKKEYEK